MDLNSTQLVVLPTSETGLGAARMSLLCGLGSWWNRALRRSRLRWRAQDPIARSPGGANLVAKYPGPAQQ